MDTPTKRCSRCRKYFPATTEWFAKASTGKYGVATTCKPCKREYDQQRMQDPEKREHHYENTKKNHQTGRYRAKAQEHNARPEVKARKKEYNQQYYSQNHEMILQQKHEYMQRPGAKLKRRLYNNLPEVRKRNLQRVRPLERKKQQPNDATREADRRRYQRRYQNANSRARIRAQAHRRLARKNAVPENYNAEDWQNALNYFNGCCAACGRQPGLWHTIAADHWIPLSAVGCPGTIPKNIVPLCHGVEGCNNRKHDKRPMDWLIEQFGKRKAKQILERIEAYFRSLK